MLIVRSRKGRRSRFIHDELVVAEAPRKQNQLTTHPRKLKLWSRKQRGRARGRQVGLEENYIGVFATAQLETEGAPLFSTEGNTMDPPEPRS